MNIKFIGLPILIVFKGDLFDTFQILIAGIFSLQVTKLPGISFIQAIE